MVQGHPHSAPRRRAARKRLATLARAVLSLAFLALGAALVWREVRDVSWASVQAALATTPPWSVAAANAFTAASYACLAGTEWVSLRAVGAGLSYREAARVAVPAYALTNSAGFSPATGGVFRLKLYTARGLTAGDAALVTLAAGTAVTLSGVITAGLLMLADPGAFGAALRLPAWAFLVLGLTLTAPAGVWFAAFRKGAPRWLGGGRAGRLDLQVRWLGLLVGVGDWIFSSAALFVLLPDPTMAVLPTFLAAYVAGSLVSAATGVPGGIGVFEGVVLTLTSVMNLAHETAAALLLYRCVYSLGPLGLWGLASAWRVARRRRPAQTT